jgi:hypothetical protein
VWAGRAIVENRKDIAFLLMAIAFESLLSKTGSGFGVTERLKLRAAFVLGHDVETRKEIQKDIERLYKIRSTIVHTGQRDSLTNRDSAMLREYVSRTIVALLTEARFVTMTTDKEFEDWLEVRQLS